MVTSGSRSGGFPTHPGNTWNAWNSSALAGFYFSGKPLFMHGAVQDNILLRQIGVCPSRPGASTPAPEEQEAAKKETQLQRDSDWLRWPLFAVFRKDSVLRSWWRGALLQAVIMVRIHSAELIKHHNMSSLRRSADVLFLRHLEDLQTTGGQTAAAPP